MADPGPVIVVGAARSGTNLLRDLLCRFDGFTTWPCDEINYIWRHGNRAEPTDELTPAHARPEVVRFVRGAFERRLRRDRAEVVVEKTCATSLRVGFAARILPDARFVVITRDGRDVTLSAMQRWTASLDVAYLARKARFVPVSDVPYYALRYARSRWARRSTGEGRVGSWGPRFAGLDDALRSRPLVEVCALQWARCVEAADEQLAESVDPARVHRLRYEQLVASPADEVARLREFLGARGAAGAHVGAEVRPDGVGRWRTALDDAALAGVDAVAGPTLKRLDYT